MGPVLMDPAALADMLERAFARALARAVGQGVPSPLARGQIVPTIRGVPANVIINVPFPTDNGTWWNMDLPAVATQILVAHPGPDQQRLALAISNVGGATIYIAETPAKLSGNRGYPLLAGQAVTADGWTGEIWGLATVAGTKVGIIELLTPLE